MTLKQRFLVFAGFLLLGVGIGGVFLPLIPTTPFILAAFFCFAKNPRLRAWILKSKILSDYITNYRERTGLKKRTVVISLVLLWSMLAVSIFFARALWAYVLLPCVGAAVTAHILFMTRQSKS